MVELQQQKRPDAIYQKQINREKDDRNERENHSVLTRFNRRPRHSPHFCAHVAQKLRHATEWAHPGSAQATLSARALALGAFAKAGSARSGSAWILNVIHNQLTLSTAGRGTRIRTRTFGFGDRRANR